MQQQEEWQGDLHTVNVDIEEILPPQSSLLKTVREEEEEEKEKTSKKENWTGRSRAEKVTKKETVKTKTQSVSDSPAKKQETVTSRSLTSFPLKALLFSLSNTPSHNTTAANNNSTPPSTPLPNTVQHFPLEIS